MPADLKQKLEEIAKQSGRSLNSELVNRLASTMENPMQVDLANAPIGDLIGEIIRRFPPGDVYIRLGRDDDE